MHSLDIEEKEFHNISSEKVIKDAIKASLKDSRELAYWQHPDNNDVYVLVGVSKERVENYIDKDILTHSIDTNKLWQKFQEEIEGRKVEESLRKNIEENKFKRLKKEMKDE